MRHSDAPDCPSCEEKLKLAHPWLRAWFSEKVKPLYPAVHVAYSYRGKEDQDRLFSEGKSKLKFPNSKHNKRNGFNAPCAEAIDLFVLKEGKALFQMDVYTEIAAKCGEGIRWGGTFKGFVDGPHFEMLPELV